MSQDNIGRINIHQNILPRPRITLDFSYQRISHRKIDLPLEAFANYTLCYPLTNALNS